MDNSGDASTTGRIARRLCRDEGVGGAGLQRADCCSVWSIRWIALTVGQYTSSSIEAHDGLIGDASATADGASRQARHTPRLRIVS